MPTPEFINSKADISWQTPPEILAGLRALFGPGGPDLDPCAGDNTSIAKFNWRLHEGYNGLTQPWPEDAKTVFINPPFGSSYVKDSKCISAKKYKALKDANQHEGWVKQTLAQWAAKTVNETMRPPREVVWISRISACSTAGQILLSSTSAVLYPSFRVCYVNAATGEQQKGANFESYVLYFGDRPQVFKDAYSSLGEVHLIRR